MTMSVNKADFLIVSKPSYVITDCPHCGTIIEIGYNDMTVISYYPGDWTGEIIRCSNCDEEVVVGYVDWN